MSTEYVRLDNTLHKSNGDCSDYGNAGPNAGIGRDDGVRAVEDGASVVSKPPVVNPVTLDEIKALAFELVEDNPMAIQALLRLVSIEASTKVPSAAVTRSVSPRLLVNLDFVSRHCHSDEEIKALIMHEYLHVLLGHTALTDTLTPNLHIALDAVINAMIHRQLGSQFSSMMSRLYAGTQGVWRWLRPPTDKESRYATSLIDSDEEHFFYQMWMALYEGDLVVGDLHEVANGIEPMMGVDIGALLAKLLGDHAVLAIGEDGEVEGDGDDDDDEDTDHGDDKRKGGRHPGDQAGVRGRWSEELKKALDEARAWLAQRGLLGSQGAGAGGVVDSLQARASAEEREWTKTTSDLLKKLVVKRPAGGLKCPTPSVGSLPVLSTSDRRGVLKSLWSPHLPMNEWVVERPVKSGTVQVYLDVSGSMDEVLPPLLALLGRFGSAIERPFWGFSTVVRPAQLKDGRLLTESSGGTSIECVLEHIAKTRPRTALIVTDGYFEAMGRDDVAHANSRRLVGEVLGDTKVWGLLTPFGSERALEEMGVGVVRLGRLNRH